MLLRVLVFTVVVAVLAQTTPKIDFNTALKAKAIPFYTVDELGKITDKLMDDLFALKTLAECGDNFMGYLISCTPITKYGTLLGLMKDNDNCLKSAGQTTDTMAVLKKTAAVLVSKLAGPYKEIITKYKAMKANGKDKAACFVQGYTISKAVLTNKLIQSIVSAAANNLTCGEWNCAQKYVTKLISVDKYNCTRTKKC